MSFARALTEAFIDAARAGGHVRAVARAGRVLNNAKNAVQEAEVIRTHPDAAMAEMAVELRRERVSWPRRSRRSGRRVGRTRPRRPTAAVKSQSRLEHIYRRSDVGAGARDDLREVAAKRELYRRLSRTSDDLRDVAERVWYSVLKQS